MNPLTTMSARAGRQHHAVQMDQRIRPDEGWWADYHHLIREMLWDDLDMGRLSRALVRTGASLGWILLAVASKAEGWWWGLPMLLVCALTIVHARRSPLVALSGWASRVQAWLLPQPDHPSIHPLGIADGVATLITAAATPFVFSQNDTGIAATLLAGISIAAGSVNVAAHVSWELGNVASSWHRWRRWGGCILGGAGAASLCPWADPSNNIQWWLAACVLVTTVFAYMYGTWRLQSSADLRRARAASIKRAARFVDSRHLHVLKNLLETLSVTVESRHASLQSGEPLPPAGLLKALRGLQAVTALTTMAWKLCQSDGNESGGMGAVEAIGYAVLVAERPFDARVLADLDPEKLQPVDRELIWTAVSDFASNAYKANAEIFTISVTASGSDQNATRQIELIAVCDCTASKALDIMPGTSLELLAVSAGRIGGVLTASRIDDHRHCYRLTWPTYARPTARNLQNR